MMWIVMAMKKMVMTMFENGSFDVGVGRQRTGPSTGSAA